MKIKCQVCEKEYKSLTSLSCHIGGNKNDHPTKQEYYDLYLKKEGENICKRCGIEKTKFVGITKGYQNFCSYKCSNQGTEKHKPKEKVEIENPEICQVCGKKFKNLQSLSNHLNHNKNKNRHTTIQDYYDKSIKKDEQEGVCKKDECKNITKFAGMIVGYWDYCSRECSQEDPNRILKTQETMIGNYGVGNCSKLDWVKKKKIKTSRENWGTDYPWQSKEGRELQKEGVQKKYGVDHVMKIPEIKEKNIKSQKKTRNTPEFKLKQSEITFKFMFNRLLNSNRLKERCIPDFNINDYKGRLYKYDWICVKCNTHFKDNLDNGKIPRCPTCYPKKLFLKISEQEIIKFCKEKLDQNYDIIQGNRTILNGQEIDIYIPYLNFGIEFNGLYYHSELSGEKTKHYHEQKTIKSKNKNIQLIHIFEDEWLNQQDIIKSILLSKLNKISDKYYARKCSITQISSKISNQFLFDSHLQGPINGKHFGLFYNNELVALLTMGKPRFNKNYDWEILRYCNKLNSTVVGGFSKLLKYFKKTYNPNSIITYADARYSNGLIYKLNNFTLLYKSNPSYFYVNKNHNKKYSRLQFQKHLLEKKLKIYDPNLTEWENMQMNNYDRIWDCGNYVYEWRR